ncbi:MAG: DNA repair protein RecO [Elusimicrobia bacterium]|nr:DNA repair protein RecO [Elusimicrobiota bacterium]
MISNEPAIVLSRRNLGEADRLCTLYTENQGKLSVRFSGVNKPGRKLKALSEPMMWAEYRLYSSPRTDIAKCIGGAIISSFPRLRGELDATVAALGCCERLDALTPLRSPNCEKYLLICAALAALEASLSPWVPAAFSLQLLEAVGYGLRDREFPDEERPLWKRLHETALDALPAVPWRPEAAERFARVADDQIEGIIGRPLRSRGYMDKLRVPAEDTQVHA